MKSIKYSDFFPSMGVLINLENEDILNIKNDIKINYEKLLYNYSKYLDENVKYYFICKEGKKSKKLVSILTIHGYDATQVIK